MVTTSICTSQLHFIKYTNMVAVRTFDLGNRSGKKSVCGFEVLYGNMYLKNIPS
jgi:hypothetical protein